MNKVKNETDSIIPLAHLLPQHLMLCEDGAYRLVEKIDPVYDMTYCTTSLTEAAVFCEGGYKEYVIDNAVIYSGVSSVTIAPPLASACEAPKSRRSRKKTAPPEDLIA